MKTTTSPYALNRRAFLRNSTLALAAASIPARLWAQTTGANDDIRIAVVGLNGRGGDHVKGFKDVKGARVVALCDVDSEVLRKSAADFTKKGNSVALYADIRELLASKEIDAISIATPNHWHSLMSIWACQAGKDVYVEKPISHNVWEGRQAVEAARKYQRIVAAGTQCRTNPGMREMMQYLHEGKLGKVKVARGLCYKRRKSIGKTTGPQLAPATVDYDLWTGPAPLVPLRRSRLHYDWHWVWPAGNGDLGNQGIHQMDLARWAIQADALSPKIFSAGGRFGYEDDGETPNTIAIFHDYGHAHLVFEVRGLPENSDSDKMGDYRGASIGLVVDCENGSMVITSYSKGKAFDKEGKVIREFSGEASHYENFIKAVRSRKPSDLNGEVLEGHLSSALCHTGNLSYQLGSKLRPEEIREKVQDDAVALETCERAYEHLQANGVDLEQTHAVWGLPLTMDPKTERFTNSDTANALLKREYRAPFVVPEKV